MTLTWSAGGAALGLIAGTAMGLVTYGFLLHETQWLPATLPVAVALIAATWLASLMAASGTHESATATAVTALATFACYAIVRLGVLAASGDPALLFAVTAVWLTGMSLVAGWLVRETAGRAPVVAGATAIAHPILAVLAVAGLFVLVVRPVQADIYFQSAAARFDQALQSDDPETFRAAEGLYARAVAANPSEDVYHLEWGERYTLVGSASGDAQTAGPWFQRAQTEVAAAERLDPLMPYHTFNRGHLQLVFAQMLPEEQRGPVAANAEIALQAAFDKLPSDPQVANELALAKLLKGDAAGATAAVALLEYVRDQLDAENPVTWQLLGRAYAAADRTEEATAALDRAMELGGGTPPGSVDPW